MKNGKRPTKNQKIAIERYGLNHENWLVFKNIEGNLHLVHKETGRTKVIPAD